ncbi:hypothetical protein C4B68_06800 [Streptomyces dengpaensis]|uniref:Uncharacterized protein n=1 Tax=Streptomyces dengpaensis TaxID=2049881 RepID=A0ABM6SMF6_9ACTN|nr:hypothetical protein C4B68_06800 [Streptomyces dengpaensis]
MGGAPSPATPCTHSRRTGPKPKYIQYEGQGPARREHAPTATSAAPRRAQGAPSGRTTGV